MPGMNPLFQSTHKGSPLEYGRSIEIMSPVAVAEMIQL